MRELASHSTPFDPAEGIGSRQPPLGSPPPSPDSGNRSPSRRVQGRQEPEPHGLRSGAGEPSSMETATSAKQALKAGLPIVQCPGGPAGPLFPENGICGPQARGRDWIPASEQGQHRESGPRCRDPSPSQRRPIRIGTPARPPRATEAVPVPRAARRSPPCGKRIGEARPRDASCPGSSQNPVSRLQASIRRDTGFLTLYRITKLRSPPFPRPRSWVMISRHTLGRRQSYGSCGYCAETRNPAIGRKSKGEPASRAVQCT